MRDDNVVRDAEQESRQKYLLNANPKHTHKIEGQITEQNEKET